MPGSCGLKGKLPVLNVRLNPDHIGPAPVAEGTVDVFFDNPCCSLILARNRPGGNAMASSSSRHTKSEFYRQICGMAAEGGSVGDVL